MSQLEIEHVGTFLGHPSPLPDLGLLVDDHAVGPHVGQRPNELVSVHFEALPLGQLPGGRVGSDRFVEHLQHIVHVLFSVHHIEARVVDPGQREHQGHDGMAVSVEGWGRPQVKLVVLELLVDGQGQGASAVSGQGDDVLLQQTEGVFQGGRRVSAATLGIGDEPVAVSHEQKGFNGHDSIKSRYLGVDFHIQQYDNEIVFNTEWPLLIFFVSLHSLFEEGSSLRFILRAPPLFILLVVLIMLLLQP